MRLEMTRALLVIACMLGGCARRARVEVTPVPSVKPPRAIVRCRTTGLDVARVTWKLGSSVKQIGWNVPKDEPAILVQWTENAMPSQLGLSCTAEDAAGRKLSAGTSLVAPVIRSASVVKGAVTVEGAGLGAPFGEEDGVWLVQRGRALRADASCKGATWDDRRIVACAPVGVNGKAELRVATGGRLAVFPVEVLP